MSGVTQFRDWCADQIVEDNGHRYLVQFVDRHERMRDRPAVFVERKGNRFTGTVWTTLPGKRADEILARAVVDWRAPAQQEAGR